MRKQVFGRKFKRDKNERKALFSGLISAMVLRGRIETTEQKAKAVRPDLEKLVTKAKKGESSRKLLTASLKNWEIDRMINDIAPKFKDRPGGYTRILKTGRRFNDDASMVIMEWVEGIAAPVKAVQPKKDSKPKKETKAEKKPAKKTAKKEALSRENK
jgi:large subunit ribosomal protein L17